MTFLMLLNHVPEATLHWIMIFAAMNAVNSVSYTHLDVYKRQLLEGSSLTLLDTRKTTPNCRVFEKYAVRVGGGCNHRYNLSDGVLLKDNHIGAAGSVAKAVAMAKAYAPFVRCV